MTCFLVREYNILPKKELHSQVVRFRVKAPVAARTYTFQWSDVLQMPIVAKRMLAKQTARNLCGEEYLMP